MTIFIAFAEADRDTATALDRFLERRGHFTELDNGETVLREVEQADVVIALISEAFTQSEYRLRLEQRALDAWSEGRLVLVRLDAEQAPVGLRDLPYVALEPGNEELAWGEVHEALVAPSLANGGAMASFGVRRRNVDDAVVRDWEKQQSQAAKARLIEFVNVVIPPLLLLPGLAALGVSISIWLANRIGPTPGTFGDLVHGIDQFGQRFAMPAGLTPWLFGLAIVVMLGALALIVVDIVKRFFGPKPNASAPAAEGAAPAPAPQAPGAAPSEAVFVSYARANATLVVPVIEAAKQSGKQFWLDQDGINAGDSWAGEIVRAIRGARGVVVMCSRAAFESDHVKREVYLADRYKKRLVPVFIEDAEPPEDFEYFFAGVQFLKLHETPEPDRPAAVLAVLEAA